MSKYIKLIAKASEESNTKEELSLLNESAEQSIEQSILNAKKRITSLKRSIASGKASQNFHADDIISDMLQLKVAEEKLTMLVALQKELF